jgi:hypothetical protein
MRSFDIGARFMTAKFYGRLHNVVWPVGRPRRPGKPFQEVDGIALHLVEGLPAPRGHPNRIGLKTL